MPANKTTRLRPDLLPGIFMLILLPLVAKGQKVKVNLGEHSWFPDGDFQYDFFMYWKSIVFLILVTGMLLVLIDRRLIRQIRIRNWKYFIPLFIYAGAVILSSFLSVDKTLTLKGMWQQYESVWVLLGYVVVAFYCAQVVENRSDMKAMLWAAVTGAIIPGIIGLTQLVGKDFFYTEAGKELLTAGLGNAVKDTMQYLYSGTGSSAVYMASYTPNYAGVYLILILPVAVVLTMTAVSRRTKIFGSFLIIMFCICLYGSGSKTGLIVGGVLVLVAGIFVQIRRNRTDRNGKKNWIYPGIGILLAVTVIAGYDLASGHTVINSVRDSFQKSTYDLEELQPEKGGITVKYKDNTLKLRPEVTEMGQILNGISNKNEQLTAVWDTDSQCFRFRNTVYEDLEFDAYSQNQISYIVIRQGEITWNFFKKQDSEKYVYLNQYGKADEICNAKAVLKGYERAFSERGYIWGRTVPLLLKHILWGSGPDTFAVEFPQTDYVMKANTSLGMYQQLPTRAHSMYLQSALQTGILSAICLLVFWLRYIIYFVKKYSGNNSSDRFETLMELGIFLSITGFLLMGIMNDSNLAAAPVFWCILGNGIAMKTFHS